VILVKLGSGERWKEATQIQGSLCARVSKHYVAYVLCEKYSVDVFFVWCNVIIERFNVTNLMFLFFV
jgi:hypothetical protein